MRLTLQRQRGDAVAMLGMALGSLDDTFGAKSKVLVVTARHPHREEEDKLFPDVRDLMQTGESMRPGKAGAPT